MKNFCKVICDNCKKEIAPNNKCRCKEWKKGIHIKGICHVNESGLTVMVILVNNAGWKKADFKLK